MKGFRLSIYWEEVGSLKEGSMEDERQLTLKRKPTEAQMTEIELNLEKVLTDMGLLKEKP